MPLLQEMSLSVWIAHVAPLLGLLGFESADGSVEDTDPHLALFQCVCIKLKHSVDHNQVKAIGLVILKEHKEVKIIPLLLVRLVLKAHKQ